jgi:hypothetical protein
MFKLDLHNPMMYPYTKFELNVCNRSRDNERKPIFGMTKGNMICPQPFHGGGIKIICHEPIYQRRFAISSRCKLKLVDSNSCGPSPTFIFTTYSFINPTILSSVLSLISKANSPSLQLLRNQLIQYSQTISLKSSQR